MPGLSLISLKETPIPIKVVLFLSYWLIAGIVLWWAYDIGGLIKGHYYEQDQAIKLVAQMGLIVAVLEIVVWLTLRKPATPARLGWRAAWRTWLVLFVYVLIILARVQFR